MESKYILWRRRWRERLGGAGGAPQILADQLTLSQPAGGEIMPT